MLDPFSGGSIKKQRPFYQQLRTCSSTLIFNRNWIINGSSCRTSRNEYSLDYWHVLRRRPAVLRWICCIFSSRIERRLYNIVHFFDILLPYIQSSLFILWWTWSTMSALLISSTVERDNPSQFSLAGNHTFNGRINGEWFPLITLFGWMWSPGEMDPSKQLGSRPNKIQLFQQEKKEFNKARVSCILF